MKTENLIDMLSTNVEPVDHRRVSRTLGTAVAIGAVIVLGLIVMALGVRHDLAHTSALLSLCLKLLFASVVLVLAVISLDKAMRPGGERNISPTVIWLPFVGIILLAVVSLAVSPSSHWRAMVLGDQWLECLISIPLIAVVPFVLIAWAVRQAAPTNLARAGALVGLVAGSISALGYGLHCTDDSVPFVALWYVGTIALCTLAGAKLGPRFLRW